MHGLVAGALVLALAACGGNSDQTGSGAAAPSAAPGQGQRTPPGAFGTIASVAASNLEVQNTSGQTTVNFNSSTTFISTVPAALQDVTVGSCVTVTAASAAAAGQPVTARTVDVSQPTNNSCARGGFSGGAGGGFGGGGFGGRSGGGSQRGANPSRQRGPGRGNGAARGAFGSVTAVNNNSFTVHETNPANNQTTDTTVTVDQATTYTKTVPANPSALVVGKCVAALGQSDDTGAVTARSITITAPGPNGCAVGGRGFGQGGQMGQNGSQNGGQNSGTGNA